jgi:murein DD-endopeptidase MepM/ murein hydrolase activator NlpD
MLPLITRRVDKANATLSYMRRLLVVAMVLTSACSQRSPWRVAPSASTGPDAAASNAASPRATSPSTTSVPSAAGIPLATAARVPSATEAADAAHVGSLYFPVAPMDSLRLDDSFDAPRDGGARVHNAIDIMAPRGAAVLAVQDGRVLRMSNNAKGGISLYASDLEDQYVYYYAHLERYHANLYSGKPLMRGDTLGYVGTTGNSPKNLPHLHFQVMRMPSDRKSYWNGAPINPYPLLKAKPAVVSVEK